MTLILQKKYYKKMFSNHIKLSMIQPLHLHTADLLIQFNHNIKQIQNTILISD